MNFHWTKTSEAGWQPASRFLTLGLGIDTQKMCYALSLTN